MKDSALANVTRWLLLAVGSLVFASPLLWMLMVSLRPDHVGLTGVNPWSFSQWAQLNPKWSNFRTALTIQPFGLYAWNTLQITLWGVVGEVLSSSLVAYGFARFVFPGRTFLFVLMLATMMLPGQVTMVPLFILFRNLGWIDTFKPLIVPAFFGSAFSIFLFRQFFMTLPRSMDEAALVDGASRFLVYWRVLMPLSKPVITTTAIFAFLGRWNDFMGPLIYLSSREKFTLSIGLASFQGLYSMQWNLMMAASLVVMMPCLLLFFCAQRFFISGILMGSVKE